MSLDCGLNIYNQMIDETEQMVLAASLILAAHPQQIGYTDLQRRQLFQQQPPDGGVSMATDRWSVAARGPTGLNPRRA